ncbi:hypothetical protein BZA05DRAFT_342847, partial [Tricharina praecox]|uniref:uncharacterized protein n=1 Tax=Tricharina praecox TaxID=43433 RepID=UPI00221EC313
MDPGPRLQVCKWTGCGENFPTSKELHDHVRDSHVANEVAVAGSFTCGWGSCPTTTKRRGKLVSHLLVHVNYKAHKCNMCEKTYKRPHELKKHQ